MGWGGNLGNYAKDYFTYGAYGDAIKSGWDWYTHPEGPNTNGAIQQDYNNENAAYLAGQKQVNKSTDKRLSAEAKDRAQQHALVSQMYDDPSRQAYYNALYGTSLQSGMNNVRDQGMNDLRGEAFNAADRGVLGGSSDIQGRGDVARSVNTNALGAEQNAYNYTHGIQVNDQNQRVNLDRLIESSNPDSQAAFAQQLQGINQQQQGNLQQAQLQQQGRDISQNAQNANSQLIGNALGYAGIQYQTDQNARAYGGQGLSYLNWANGSGSNQGIRS